MVLHHLKVWPRFYDALADGSKRYEVRKNDRNFAVDDVLVFHLWDPDTATHLDSPILYAKVLGIAEDLPGLMKGFVIMDISEVRRP